MRVLGWNVWCALILLVGAASVAAAQDNYEIQVYGAATVAPRTTTFELHSNSTFDGRKNSVNGLYPTDHAGHEVLWKGSGVTQGVGFSPNVKVGYDFPKKISGGVEYYGSFGQMGNFAPASEQQHRLFGAVDQSVSPLWEINFGLGVGTTPATDHLIAKLTLGHQVRARNIVLERGTPCASRAARTDVSVLSYIRHRGGHAAQGGARIAPSR